MIPMVDGSHLISSDFHLMGMANCDVSVDGNANHQPNVKQKIDIMNLICKFGNGARPIGIVNGSQGPMTRLCHKEEQVGGGQGQ